MSTLQIFNANTQQIEEAMMSVDSNNEIIARFADGSFLKFPAGLTADEFSEQINEVQKANDGQEVITPEYEASKEAERTNSYELIGEAIPVEPTIEANTIALEGIQSDAIESTSIPIQ